MADDPPNPDQHQSLRPRPATTVGAGRLSHTSTSPAAVKPDPRPVGTFSYLPEDYNKPTIPISGNTLADNTAARVKEIFTTQVLERRRAVDNHLMEFKRSLGKETDELPRCFVSWKNSLFQEWEQVPDQESFVVEFCPGEGDDSRMLKAIHANKHRQFLTPELIATGQHMNNLLDECHSFRLHKDDMKREIKELNLQLLRIELRSKAIDSIQSELQSLPYEIDQFGEEIDTLLKNILAAFLPYGQTQKGRVSSLTGSCRQILIAAK